MTWLVLGHRLPAASRTIEAHDALGADNAAAALTALARCRAALDEFARRVYETDNVSPAGAANGGARDR